MGYNNAENQIGDAFVNRLNKLDRDFNDFKTTPQKIGNGSLGYGYFTPITAGPFTIPPGLTANVGIKYMDSTQSFTYNGQPAINRVTLLEVLYSITVDTDDVDHVAPYGQALTPGQQMLQTSYRYDFYATGYSDVDGQRYVIIQVTNTDTDTHNYWVHSTAIIPRPALKPQ